MSIEAEDNTQEGKNSHSSRKIIVSAGVKWDLEIIDEGIPVNQAFEVVVEKALQDVIGDKEEIKPPKGANILLDFTLPLDKQDGVIGDLEERFLKRIERYNGKVAIRWYWNQAISYSVSAIAERVRGVLAWIVGIVFLFWKF